MGDNIRFNNLMNSPFLKMRFVPILKLPQDNMFPFENPVLDDTFSSLKMF